MEEKTEIHNLVRKMCLGIDGGVVQVGPKVPNVSYLD